jgi:putative ABC transport system permease protein
LTEASDNVARYKILSRIGAEAQMINQVVFNQIITYFILPLILALSHSFVIIQLIHNISGSNTEWSIMTPVYTTGSILFIIYGGYIYITYNGYKKIIK